MRLVCFLMAILSMLFVATIGYAIEGVETSYLKVKKLKLASGYMYYTAKVTVKNTTSQTKKVHVEIQGVDRDGFEINSFTLSGAVKARSRRTLTDSSIIDFSEWRRIKKWQIDEIW